MQFTERREGEDYVYETDRGDVRVVFANVRESSGDLSAVVRAYHLNGRGPVPLMAPSRLNLVAPRSRAEVAKAIAARGEPMDLDPGTWGQILEYCCGRTYSAWERGAPFVDLSEYDPPGGGLDYLLEPLVIAGETVLWVADGGSGKSSFAAAAALSLYSGREIVPGMKPTRPASTVICDWESNAAEVTRRLRGLARGGGLDPPIVRYRGFYRSLHEEIGTLRREVDTHGHSFAVIDSVVPACGGDVKDAQAARDLFNALRSLGDGVARVGLAHMNKVDAGKETGRATAIGSVMFTNLARSVWELRRSEDAPADELVTGFYHRKANGDRLRPPFALRIRYGEDQQPERIERVRIDDYPDLAERLPRRDRIAEILRTGAKTTAEIAEALNMSLDGARKALQRRPEIVQFGGGRGRGNAATWGLQTTAADEASWWE